MARNANEGYDFSDENFGISGLRITLWMIRAVLLAIVVVSLWSYNETQDFFSGSDVPGFTFYGIGAISHGFSILFQYGQSPLFYLMLRYGKRASIRLATLRQASFSNTASALQVAKYKQAFFQDALGAGAFGAAWVLFCFVDGGSNVIQVNRNQYETDWSRLVMHIVAVGSIFIEELFMFILDVAKALATYVEHVAAHQPPEPSIGERFVNWILGIKKAATVAVASARQSYQRAAAPAPKPASRPSPAPSYHPAVQRGFSDFEPQEQEEPQYHPLYPS
jgi:hypothetical protein